jgi:hypothetical protein
MFKKLRIMSLKIDAITLRVKATFAKARGNGE